MSLQVLTEKKYFFMREAPWAYDESALKLRACVKHVDFRCLVRVRVKSFE